MPFTRVTTIDMTDGQPTDAQWTPEVYSVPIGVTPTDGDPFRRYQTPVKRGVSVRRPPAAQQPGHRA